MQVVIPMSGFGERFRRAGYTMPKPLIEVDEKKIIEYLVDMFPKDSRFVFICNREHLETPEYGMRQTLESYCPNAEIVAIEPHKLGPVNAVLQAADSIDLKMPIIVSYCDYAFHWRFEDFESHLQTATPDGCVITYTGFHPHMLGSVNYAYVLANGDEVLDLQEKRPYTDDPMSEHASAGAYYFSSGAKALEYFNKTIALDLTVNGEYYVSMVYKPMIADGLTVTLFDVPYFMQWGTPGDLAEYRYFSDMFRMLNGNPQKSPPQPGTVMIPMAGAGKRFMDAGLDRPKPLIPVSGRPMVLQAAADLPAVPKIVLITREDQVGGEAVLEELAKEVFSLTTVEIDYLTDGQARTCMAGFSDVAPGLPLTIGACDNGMLYQGATFKSLLEGGGADVIVWGIRGYPGAIKTPEAYGWVEEEDGRIVSVSVKRPLNDCEKDAIVVGTFTFRRADMFRQGAERLFHRDGRVNGEFYVDSLINDCIALGLKVRLFEIDSYLCWGSPDDWRRYAYWQSCFHSWPSHPYRMENDVDIADASTASS